MNYDLLARFITKTSDWSEFKRGREVFQSASELFSGLFQIDFGFFVYKKRLPLLSEPFKIYNPWGNYNNIIELFQFFLDTNNSMLDYFIKTHNGQWLNVKDFPFEINLNIQEFGIWNMYSRGKIVGFLALGRSQSKTYLDENVISICVKQISLILDMMLAWRTSDEMSRIDPLTGVLNRRGIFDLYEPLILNARTNGNKIMIGLIDIDNFKQINDTYGHLEGDRALIKLANTLKNNMSSTDLVGRFGGDEFVLVLQTQHQNPQVLEQRIKDLFPFTSGFSISVGFAVWNIEEDDWDKFYNSADKRLYSNKFTNK